MSGSHSVDARTDGAQALLEVRDLHVHFDVGGQVAPWRARKALRAVDGVSLALRANETLGLVGESGCGKSTLARAVMRLITPSSGSVRFEGADIATLSQAALERFRPKMQMVFQDPGSSLNPRMTIEQALAEPMRIAHWEKARIRQRIDELLGLVGLDTAHLRRYPHEFSGGQKQRIVIARALALHPEVVVCDEPVSALDVSVQAQIINLLKDIQERLGVAYLFVAHDLAVVRQVSHRVMVMYLGRIVEEAAKGEFFSRPLHPYSKALLSAIPRPRGGPVGHRIMLVGELPSPMNPPSGCRFRTRCPIAQSRCSEAVPELREVRGGHRVACHLVGEVEEEQECFG